MFEKPFESFETFFEHFSGFLSNSDIFCPMLSVLQLLSGALLQEACWCSSISCLIRDRTSPLPTGVFLIKLPLCLCQHHSQSGGSLCLKVQRKFHLLLIFFWGFKLFLQPPDLSEDLPLTALFLDYIHLECPDFISASVYRDDWFWQMSLWCSTSARRTICSCQSLMISSSSLSMKLSLSTSTIFTPVWNKTSAESVLLVWGSCGTTSTWCSLGASVCTNWMVGQVVFPCNCN